MDILVQAIGLILSLSLLVIIHEGGHFFFAKLFNTKVEKFYLFFNPKFSLVRFKKGETEYGIGWIPLGGYVKIAGMIDESMDKEQMQKPPQPWEFRAKPAWQRFFIMTGGVLANLLLAMVIFIMILFSNGREYIPAQSLDNGFVWDSVALKSGLQNGDKVLRIDGEPVQTYKGITQKIVSNTPETITVLRDQHQKTISLPDNFVQEIMSKKAVPLVMPATPAVIDSVLPGHPAYKAGLQKHDTIIRTNGIQTPYYIQIVDQIQKNKDDSVTIGVRRNGTFHQLAVRVNEEGKIGIAFKPWTDFITPEKKSYNFIEAIPAGFSYFGEMVVNYVKSLKLLFTEEGAKQIGSFGTIGSMFPTQWDWLRFWHVTAFISIILAVINILPIPALDGGHLMFLGYEAITGRKPSDKVMEYAQIIGMILLFSLFILAINNDIRRFLIN